MKTINISPDQMQLNIARYNELIELAQDRAAAGLTDRRRSRAMGEADGGSTVGTAG